MNNSTQLISVIVPVLNESYCIEKCLDSIISQDYPSEKMEILIVDGMSNDGTRSIINNYSLRDKRIRLLDNKHQRVPNALNIGIKESHGSIIVRMDSHCIYPSNYISVLVDKLIQLDAWNVGGVWKIIPGNDSSACLAIAICSGHPIGVGMSLHKIGCSHIIETDTVPFGCFKREVFDIVGYYDEEMQRNEDEELNGRIRKIGGRIILIPEVTMQYIARNSMRKMLKMYYQYGLWKPIVNKKVGEFVSFRQFAPPFFVLFIILGLMLGVVFKSILYMVLGVCLIYSCILFTLGVINAFKNRRPSLCLLIPLTFVLIHFSYGIGYLRGILSIIGHTPLKYSLDRS